MIKLDCREVSDKILENIKSEVDDLKSKGKRLPWLTVIQVGNNSASNVYVRKKKEKAEDIGFLHTQYNLDENATEEELIDLIYSLNNNEAVDGILVQLPLPKHINENRVIEAIDPSKDVDGFSPINVGKMMLGQKCFLPCTPYGILEIIKYFNIETKGKNVIVFGRSNIVGRPISNLLSQKPWDANVRIIHSKTSDGDKLRAVEDADIIILSVGKPYTLDFSTYAGIIKAKATIIDVGINRIKDSSKKSGFRLCGDFESWGFQEMEDLGNETAYKELRYTPVPNGVGIMTTTMLMKNVLEARNARED